MNLKRVTWMSVVLYLVTFAIGLIVGAFFNYDPTVTMQIPMNVLILTLLLTLVATAWVTKWYFTKKPAMKPSLKEGALFGVAFMIVGTILDLLLIIPFVLTSIATWSDVLVYYVNPLFWITLVLLIGTSSLTGLALQKGSKRKR
ncbi:MAG: hypothetical protein Q8Q01_05060 [archaeon]|nr:hypothetical protein [archaeon]